MPKNHNHVTITIWSNGAASYGLHDRVDSLVDFRNVEVAPVPPHGRLIDADALIESFDPSDFWNPDAEDNCFAAVHVVNSAPTVIPAEEGET